MRILVIDDEQSQRNLLAGYLTKQGHEVRQAGSGPEALALLEQRGAETAITDMRMPDMDGLTLLEQIKSRYPDMQVVVITAFATVENAVTAMKQGAADYLLKPVNLEQLTLILKKIEDSLNLVAENRYLKRKLESVESFPDMIGQSAAFQKTLADISQVCQSDTTVLIRGESGTGKELVARAIHSGSKRANGPFLAVNCAALPETLLESELFGYERGAFTGAQKRRIGRFELADRGSLFLDEIGDLSPTMQVKLLRVLETRSFERLGGSESIKVDIRLITATNRNLEKKIADGSFREDLFFRLNVVPINLPPLRERKDDILLLVDHFIKKFAAKSDKHIKGLTPEAKDILINYNWPGNIRELENVIERAVVLTRSDTIDKACLSGLTNAPVAVSFGGDLNLENLEKKAILEALRQSDGKIIEAAGLLGIHRNTLRLKIKHFGIEPIE
ncbi:MAG: sigma-54-dependent Fis family transcriptional regulator [candidate division Zixibacteria bacterium]|nr:sigma-54-dependent Fis family transcriptional regulator [candidate division Zixibacteria bacterium]